MSLRRQGYNGDVLGNIINHEMLVEEAQHVKNLSKGIISSKKQDIAFKATKKSKSKKVVEETQVMNKLMIAMMRASNLIPKRWPSL
jgi:hypothetical protein